MFKRIMLPAIFLSLAYGFWLSPDFSQIAAGVAIFLFGMLSMENGFEAFAGGVLEKILKKSTDKLYKALGFGVLVTTLVQSSSLVSVITISFLSAGLLGLREGIGIIFGANLGTTTGAWLVAGYGLKLDLSVYAMPLLVFGVILIFQRSRDMKGMGYILGGVGFLLLGIDHMKLGFEAFKGGLDLSRYAMEGVKGLVVYTFFGTVATFLMQSSHATLILTITALAAAQITYPNALAVAVGANVGTTITAVLGSLSANITGKRLAGAHLIFNLVTGALALAFINYFTLAVDKLSELLGIAPDNYTLKLALFHTLFNLVGIAVMLPLVRPLTGLLYRVIKGAAAGVAGPRYLTNAALDFPDTAVESVRKELVNMYQRVLSIMCDTLGFKGAEVFSKTDLQALVREKGPVGHYPIDEVYQNDVKLIFSAVIEFISRASFTWEREQSGKLHWLRAAGGDLVEAVKGLKHLQKNLVRYTAGPNRPMREEYQRIRYQIAAAMRELEELRHNEDPDLLVLALDHLKLKAEEIDAAELSRIYQLINDGLITPAMGTSLINDYGYMSQILQNLISAGATLFVGKSLDTHSAQRTVSLDSDELRQVLVERKEARLREEAQDEDAQADK